MTCSKISKNTPKTLKAQNVKQIKSQIRRPQMRGKNRETDYSKIEKIRMGFS